MFNMYKLFILVFLPRKKLLFIACDSNIICQSFLFQTLHILREEHDENYLFRTTNQNY